MQSSNHAQIRKIIHAFQLLALSLYCGISDGFGHPELGNIGARVSIAVVFVIFAVEFMNTTANLTKTTAINDNAPKNFSISCKFESFRAKKKIQKFFEIFFFK